MSKSHNLNPCNCIIALYRMFSSRSFSSHLKYQKELGSSGVKLLGTNLVERLITWQNSASRILFFCLGGRPAWRQRLLKGTSVLTSCHGFWPGGPHARELSEPWHPTVYRSLVPTHLLHLRAISCRVHSQCYDLTEPPDLVP